MKEGIWISQQNKVGKYSLEMGFLLHSFVDWSVLSFSNIENKDILKHLYLV